MSDINISMDITDVVQKTKTLLGLTDAQAESLKNFTEATRKYNDAGDENVAVLKAQVGAGKDIVVTLQKEGDAYVFTTARLKELSAASLAAKQQRVDDAKAAADAVKAAAQVDKEASQAAANVRRDQEAQRREARQKELQDIRAAAKEKKRIADDAKAAASASNVSSIDNTVRQQTETERQRLKNVNPKFDISGANQGKLLVISRQIAELGNQAGLTSAQIQKLFTQVASGDFGNIDGKYAKVVDQIQKYNAVINGNAKSNAPGKFPAPDTPALDSLRTFLTLVNRIGSTLTNLALYRGFNLITQQLTEAVKAAQQYQIQISLIRTLSQDNQLSSGQFAEGLKKVSNELGIDLKSVNAAAYDAVSNQVAQGAGTFKFIKDAGDLARVTGSDIKDAGNLLAGVINSYGKSAEDAADISAKLFRTIDRGRIQVKDLSDTFGRAAFIAHDLGVPLEEVLAVLSTLTRNGTSTDDAVTLLNNSLQQLSKPTTAMSAALANMGATSGRSAVQVNGLRGTLVNLFDQIKSGKAELTDLVPDIRAERGFTALRNDIEGFDKDRNTDNAGDRYAKAQEIRAESAADKIKKVITTTENAVSNSFGNAFVNLVGAFVDVSAKADDMEKSISKVLRTVGAFTLAIVAGGAALKALAVLSEIETLRAAKRLALKNSEITTTVAHTAALRAEAAAAGQASAAQIGSTKGGVTGLAANNPAGLIAAGVVTAIGAYAAYKSVALDTFDSTGQAIDEMYAKLKSGEVTKALEKNLEITKALKKEFDDIQKVIGERLQRALITNNDALKDIRNSIRQSQDSLRAGFVGAIDLANNRLSEMQRKLHDIPGILEAAKKGADGFGDKINQTVFNQQLKYAAPGQQPILIQNGINRDVEKIKRLYVEAGKGSKEAEQEANKLFDDVLNKYVQLDEAQNTQAKHAQEARVAELASHGQPILPQDLVVGYSAIPLQNKLNDLLKLRLDLNKQLEYSLAKQKVIQEAQVAAEKTKNAAIQLAVKRFEEFSVTNEDGSIKKEFQGVGGGLDPNKAKAGFAEASKNVDKFIPSDVLSRLNFGKQVQDRKSLLDEELKRLGINKDITDQQRQQGQAAKDLEAALRNSDKATNSYNENQATVLNNLRQYATSLRDLSASAPAGLKDTRATVGTSNALGRVLGQAGVAATDLNPFRQKANADEATRFGAIQARADALRQRIDNANDPKNFIEKDGRKIINPNEVEGIKQEVLAVKDALQSVLDKAIGRAKLDTNSGAAFLPGSKTSLGDSGKILDAEFNKSNDATQGLNAADAALRQAQSNLNKVKNIADSAALSTGQATNSVLALIGGIGVTADNTVTALNRVTAAAREAANAQATKPVPEAAGGLLGALGLAGGGQHFAFGGPTGSDNVAFKANNEYVLNPGATNRFFSQAQAMNNAGRSSTTFNNGPVTFNINESKTPDQTAQAISGRMQRAQRQGII